MHAQGITRRQFFYSSISQLLEASSPDAYLNLLYNLAVEYKQLRQVCADEATSRLNSPYILKTNYKDIGSSFFGFTDCQGRFGTHQPSIVELYPDSFKPFLIELRKGIILKPQVYFLILTLVHEDQHAEDNYKGFDFGEGLVYGSNNIHGLNNFLRGFIEESRAYLTELKRASSLGNFTNDANLLASYCLYRYVSRSLFYVKKQELSPIEQTLLKMQVDDLHCVHEEVADTLSLAADGKIKFEISY